MFFLSGNSIGDAMTMACLTGKSHGKIGIYKTLTTPYIQNIQSKIFFSLFYR